VNCLLLADSVFCYRRQVYMFFKSLFLNTAAHIYRRLWDITTCRELLTVKNRTTAALSSCLFLLSCSCDNSRSRSAQVFSHHSLKLTPSRQTRSAKLTFLLSRWGLYQNGSLNIRYCYTKNRRVIIITNSDMGCAACIVFQVNTDL
jgi:hypothetical protein